MLNPEPRGATCLPPLDPLPVPKGGLSPLPNLKNGRKHRNTVSLSSHANMGNMRMRTGRGRGAHGGIRRASCDCIWPDVSIPAPLESLRFSYRSRYSRYSKGKDRGGWLGKRRRGRRAIIEIRWDRMLSRGRNLRTVVAGDLSE